jgi:RNA polymerase sigma-70 factor (ECF subfamily)
MDELFEEVYAAFHAKIYRYLRRLVGEQDAEDLTQEVFAKVSRSITDFRGEAQLSTWIYRIATNAAIDRLRSPIFLRGFNECLSVDILEESENTFKVKDAWTGEKKPSVEQQVMRNAMNNCISGLIQDLPENYRTVLLLSELEGLDNKEIANILEVSVGNVKIRLHRARKKLRQALATHCDFYWLEDNEFVPELNFSPK